MGSSCASWGHEYGWASWGHENGQHELVGVMKMDMNTDGLVGVMNMAVGGMDERRVGEECR